MNAVADRRPHRRGTGGVAAALRACTPRRQRRAVVAFSLLLFGLTALTGFAGLEGGADSERVGLGLFVAVANFTLWSGWFSRLLLLQSHMRRLCAPRAGAAAGGALLAAAIVTLAVPTALLIALGLPWPVALGASVLGAVCGLLFITLPAPAAIALLCLPAAGPLLWPLLTTAAPWSTPVTAALGGVLVVVCARAVLKTADPATIPAWRRPLLLQTPGNMALWNGTDPEAAPAAPRLHDGWLFAMPRPTHAGPHAPGAAIDALLAGPLGYVARRTAMLQWAVIALAVAALVLIPIRGDAVFLRDALLLGGAIGLLASGWTLAMRLELQRRRLAGEQPELALLPGLGTPEAAAGRLLRRVMRRLGQLLLVAAAGLLLVAWLRALAWPHVALLTGLLAGASAAGVLLCAAALAGWRVISRRMFVAMLPLLLAATATLMVVMIRIPVVPHAATWALVWTVLPAAYLAAAWPALRRARARPHAFLLD